LWIGIAVVLVVLIALGITGFVAPGFFLSKDSNSAGPESTEQALVDNINKKDKAALTSMKCPDASRTIDTLINQINNVKSAASAGPPQKVSDTAYTASLSVTLNNGRKQTYSGQLAQENGNWCIKSVDSGSGSSSSNTSSPTSTSSTPGSTGIPPVTGGTGDTGSTGAQATAQKWTDGINSSDKDTLKGLLCQLDQATVSATNGVNPALATVAAGTKYAVGQSQQSPNDPNVTLFNIDGSGGSSPASAVLSVSSKNGTFCVSAFRAG
jgi:hypothetical protein